VKREMHKSCSKKYIQSIETRLRWWLYAFT